MQTTWIILVLCAIFTASSEAAFGKHTKHDKIVKRRIRGNFFMTGGAGASFPRRALLQVLGGTAVGLPFLGEIYARLGGGGADYSVNIPFTDVPQSWGDIEDVTIVFHGAGGQDAYTDELMQNLKKSGDQKKSYETIIDWSDLSSNILQASFNGQRYGRFVAAQIMKETKQFKKLKTVHFIGISVGAFAADAAVKEFKEGSSADRHNSVVQLTLLDPFAQRGVIGPRYGDRNFGISADYAQQFLNTVRACLRGLL